MTETERASYWVYWVNTIKLWFHSPSLLLLLSFCLCNLWMQLWKLVKTFAPKFCLKIWMKWTKKFGSYFDHPHHSKLINNGFKFKTNIMTMNELLAQCNLAVKKRQTDPALSFGISFLPNVHSSCKVSYITHTRKHPFTSLSLYNYN